MFRSHRARSASLIIARKKDSEFNEYMKKAEEGYNKELYENIKKALKDKSKYYFNAGDVANYKLAEMEYSKFLVYERLKKDKISRDEAKKAMKDIAGYYNSEIEELQERFERKNYVPDVLGGAAYGTKKWRKRVEKGKTNLMFEQDVMDAEDGIKESDLKELFNIRSDGYEQKTPRFTKAHGAGAGGGGVLGDVFKQDAWAWLEGKDAGAPPYGQKGTTWHDIFQSANKAVQDRVRGHNPALDSFIDGPKAGPAGEAIDEEIKYFKGEEPYGDSFEPSSEPWYTKPITWVVASIITFAAGLATYLGFQTDKESKNNGYTIDEYEKIKTGYPINYGFQIIEGKFKFILDEDGRPSTKEDRFAVGFPEWDYKNDESLPEYRERPFIKCEGSKKSINDIMEDADMDLSTGPDNPGKLMTIKWYGTEEECVYWESSDYWEDYLEGDLFSEENTIPYFELDEILDIG